MSSYALQLRFPKFRLQSRRKSFPLSFKDHPHLRVLCIPPHSDGHDASPDTGTPRNYSETEGQLILVEKYGNGTSKSYMLDNDSKVTTFLEKHFPPRNASLGSKELSWLPKIIKDLFLPTGYPGIMYLIPFGPLFFSSSNYCVENSRGHILLAMKRNFFLHIHNCISSFMM